MEVFPTQQWWEDIKEVRPEPAFTRNKIARENDHLADRWSYIKRISSSESYSKPHNISQKHHQEGRDRRNIDEVTVRCVTMNDTHEFDNIRTSVHFVPTYKKKKRFTLQDDPHYEHYLEIPVSDFSNRHRLWRNQFINSRWTEQSTAK